VGIVLVASIGWLVFQQKLDAAAVIGISLIIAGVLIMQIWSDTGSH
jgi:small multidrug resistance pump